MQSLKKDLPTDLSIESSRHQQPSISPTPSYISSSSSSTSSKAQESSKSLKKPTKVPNFPNSNNLQFNNNLLDLNSLILKNQDIQSQQANNQNISSFLNLIKSVFPASQQQQQQTIPNNPFSALYANPALQFASLLSNPLLANCLNSQMPINDAKNLTNSSDIPFSTPNTSNNEINDEHDNTQPINLSNKKSQSPNSQQQEYEVSDAPLDLSSRKSTPKPSDLNILKAQFNDTEHQNLKKIFDQNLKLSDSNMNSKLFSKSQVKKSSTHKNSTQQQISPGSVSNSSSTSPSASNSSCSSLSSYSFENNLKSNEHAKSQGDDDKNHKANDSLKKFEKKGNYYSSLFVHCAMAVANF